MVFSLKGPPRLPPRGHQLSLMADLWAITLGCLGGEVLPVNCRHLPITIPEILQQPWGLPWGWDAWEAELDHTGSGNQHRGHRRQQCHSCLQQNSGKAVGLRVYGSHTCHSSVARVSCHLLGLFPPPGYMSSSMGPNNKLVHKVLAPRGAPGLSLIWLPWLLLFLCTEAKKDRVRFWSPVYRFFCPHFRCSLH